MSLVGQATQPLVDPLTRTIETRTYQMKVAIELGLWTTAFHTAEELFALLSRKRPSQSQLVTYYSNLAQILWMSCNSEQHQLFHAACVVKHAALNLSASTADEAVLAVLATSVADSLAPISSDSIALSDETAGSDLSGEKSARLTTLTGSGSVPCTQSLLSDLIAKDVVSHASESVKSIYSLLSGSKIEARNLNEKLAPYLKQLPVSLAKYKPALARFALVKVTQDLQSMYSCIGFEKFQSLTKDILPLEESIKLLGQLKRTDQVNVCIDYQSRTISFSAAPSASSGINAALETLRNAAAQIRSSREGSSDLFEEEVFFARLDEERRECDKRRNAADSRKDAIELENVRKMQQLADQLKRAEEERLESDAKARANEIARRELEAKKREEILLKAKALVEKINSIGGQLTNLTDDALVELGVDKLEQTLKNQVNKERQDRISKRRNESRRLEHTARLFRIAENEKISQWAETVYEKDKAVFDQMAKEKADEWRKAAESKRASIDALKPFAAILTSWKDSKTIEFNRKIATKAEERRMKNIQSRQVSQDSEAVESDVAPTSTLSRDEFKEMARSLPSWKEPSVE